ncbi:hypothetical protein ACJJTC_013417 [Scirpophaga incertulas]
MLSRNQMLANIFFVILAGVERYCEENTTLVFNFFKEKYHKHYTNKAEEAEAYENFVKNLNKVTALNGNPKEVNTIYTLNKYADINPEEIQEHFALNVSAYDVNNIPKGPNKQLLRSEQIRSSQPEVNSLESLELYDLDDADNLFKKYMKAFEKKYSKKYDRTLHFYRMFSLGIEMVTGKQRTTCLLPFPLCGDKMGVQASARPAADF